MTRTVSDRLAELQGTFNKRRHSRIRADLTDDVVRLHDEDPTQILDCTANSVLRFLRSQPIIGKHLIYSAGPDGPWRLGRVTPGAPGNLTIEATVFDQLEDAMRAVFEARRQEFLGNGQDSSAGVQEIQEGVSR